MAKESEVRHTFQGSHRYRVFLLAVTLGMAVTLVVAGVVFDADKSWAHQLCLLVAALSAASFACLVAVDICRPQVISAARMKVALKFFLILPAVAIALAVLGFIL